MTTKGCHVNFAWDPLGSYFDETKCQKNEICFSYIYPLFFNIIIIHYLWSLNVNLGTYAVKKTDVFGYYIQREVNRMLLSQSTISFIHDIIHE